MILEFYEIDPCGFKRIFGGGCNIFDNTDDRSISAKEFGATKESPVKKLVVGLPSQPVKVVFNQAATAQPGTSKAAFVGAL